MKSSELKFTVMIREREKKERDREMERQRIGDNNGIKRERDKIENYRITVVLFLT